MDAIFVFGDKAAQDRDGRLYTGTSFSQEIFDRYLEHFDHLTLLMRKANVDPEDRESLDRMNLLTDKRISIVFLPDTMDSVKNFTDPSVSWQCSYLAYAFLLQLYRCKNLCEARHTLPC